MKPILILFALCLLFPTAGAAQDASGLDSFWASRHSGGTRRHYRAQLRNNVSSRCAFVQPPSELTAACLLVWLPTGAGPALSRSVGGSWR